MKTILREKWGIDSNLIIYSLDKDSEFYLGIRKFMDFVLSEKMQLHVTHQNILETQNVLKKRYSVSFLDSAASISKFLKVGKCKVINPLPSTLMIYEEFLKDFGPKADHYDVYLASTLKSNDIHGIFTNNTKDFTMIPDLEVINPLTLKL